MGLIKLTKDLFSRRIKYLLSYLLLGIVLVPSFSLTGCSSNSIYLPDQTYFSPETSGELLKGDFGGGIRSMTKITVFKDINVNPPTASGSEINGVGPSSIETSAVGLTGGLGLLDFLDLIYMNGFGFKLGSKRDGDGWKMSTAAVREGFSFGPPFGTDGFSASVKKTSFALSSGYRFNNHQLVYSSYIREWFEVFSDSIKNQQSSFNVRDTGLHERLNIGYELAGAEKIRLFFEASLTHTEFPRSEAHNGSSFGFGVKRYW